MGQHLPHVSHCHLPHHCRTCHLRSARTSTRAPPTALEDNLNQHPLPPTAPKNPSLRIPEPTEIGQRQPHAQKRFAAISQRAWWLDGFGPATPTQRAIILSQSHQGAMFAFNAVPNKRHMHGAVLPATFVNAVQLRLRIPSHSWQVPPHVSAEQPWTDMATTSCHAHAGHA